MEKTYVYISTSKSNIEMELFSIGREEHFIAIVIGAVVVVNVVVIVDVT